MGRLWKRKQKAEAKEQKKDKPRFEKPKTYIPIAQGNRKMEAYYALQGLHDYRLDEETQTFRKCETDQEREQERLSWMTSLRSILPASFRIGADVHTVLRERLEMELEEFVGTEMEILVDPKGGRRNITNDDDNEKDAGDASGDDTSGLIKKKIAPAKRIPFIPHGYQLSLDRRTIRRNPGLVKFHDWLKVQTSAGFVTRQETVSMIPPVVLSVESHHSVLDMCAAPGSKTSQILEIVSSPTNVNDLEPRGCVVANDSDAKRAYMLVHQLRRINSPAHLVTSCDAQFFPLLKGAEEEGMFDRVLCDVPCSGDGTTRKNPGVWKNWTALGSLALHPLQLSIALNGARLTKVGGYVCYSTCAMSPIENEAVVAELIRAADGSLELVDKRPDMPGLMARPGWSTWRVLREEKSRKEIKDKKKKNNQKMQERRKAWEAKRQQEKESESKADDADIAPVTDDVDIEANKDHIEVSSSPPSWDEETLKARAVAVGLTEYQSFDDVPEEWRRRVRKSCFPPTDEEAASFQLERCLRCLPHDMDTGGFFVALLRKVKPMSAKARARALALARELGTDVDEEDAASGPDAKRARIETGEEQSKASDSSDGMTTEKEATDGIPSENVNDANLDPESTMEDEQANTTKPDVNEAETSKVANEKPQLRGRGGAPRGDAERFIPVEDSVWEPLVEYYGLSTTFPREQYMARASGEAKVLYFIGRPIKDLMKRGIQERVSIVNTGLKGFERNNKDCKVKYRVTQEGVHYLAPHMTQRMIKAKLDDFSKCLDTGGIRLENMSNDFGEAVRPLDPGSFVVALEGYERDVFQKMFLVMWRCRGDAMNCLVAKVEMDGMKSKLRAVTELNGADIALDETK